MAKGKWYAIGKDAGFNTASWADLPEVGSTVYSDATGRTEIATEADAWQAVESAAFEGEQNSRQYSDHPTHGEHLTDKQWDDYEAGVSAGIFANVKQRKRGAKSNPRKRKRKLMKLSKKMREVKAKSALRYVPNPAKAWVIASTLHNAAPLTFDGNNRFTDTRKPNLYRTRLAAEDKLATLRKHFKNDVLTRAFVRVAESDETGAVFGARPRQRNPKLRKGMRVTLNVDSRVQIYKPGGGGEKRGVYFAGKEGIVKATGPKLTTVLFDGDELGTVLSTEKFSPTKGKSKAPKSLTRRANPQGASGREKRTVWYYLGAKVRGSKKDFVFWNGEQWVRGKENIRYYNAAYNANLVAATVPDYFLDMGKRVPVSRIGRGSIYADLARKENPAPRHESEIAIFTSRTGMTHKRMPGSARALPCNSAGRMPRGSPGVTTREQLKSRRLCEKCFGPRDAKENPAPRHDAEIEAAAQLQADFSGHEPANVDTLSVPEPAKVYTPVGKLAGVLYDTTRDGKPEKYIHRFRRKSRPLLLTSHDGTQLRIAGGRFRFTEAGIVDE